MYVCINYLFCIFQIGLEKKCSRLDFVVLDWNKNSIEYYKRKGSIDMTQLEGWHLFRMQKREMEELVKT